MGEAGHPLELRGEEDGVHERPGAERDSLLHRYPNNEDQHAATLWYHDHSVHVTGHHLFRGLVGLYILTDEVEDALPLPKGYGRYDVPLVIEDIMIDPDTGVAV